jgi:putative hydrolase of the HAD superfamily
MNKQADTLLFDLDDTLIVELKSAEESFLETISQLDAQINAGEFLNAIQKQARDLWYNLPTIEYCLKIGISSREGLWADFTTEKEEYKMLRELSGSYRFNTWNQTLIKFNINDARIAERLSSDFIRIRNSKHILFPETTDILTKLSKRYKLGLITNGAPDLQWKKIIGGNLKHYFDYVAVSGEHGYAKPDKRLFDIAIRGLESTPDRTVIIGDRLTTDIKGGSDAGLTTIWVNRDGGMTDEIKPDYEVATLTEIHKILHTL